MKALAFVLAMLVLPAVAVTAQTPPRTPSVTAAPDPCAEASADWRRLSASTDVAAIRLYVDRLPDQCATQRALADARLAELERTPARTSSQLPTLVFPDARDASARTRAPVRRALTPVRDFTLFRDCAACPEMVALQAGAFIMGKPAGEQPQDGYAGAEEPTHRVSVARFAIGRFEITFDNWRACVAAGGCGAYQPSDNGWGRGRRPVINVSWQDAQGYVRWLNQQTGGGYRLVTEAEWEYAARAGATTAYSTGASIDTGRANYDGVVGRPTEVGRYAPNPWGIHDMHGNIWEWVEDCWHANYVSAPSTSMAWTEGTCAHRVNRGGGFANTAKYLRSAYRIAASPQARSPVAGFRVARTLS